jgi:hypothetical protein
LGPASTLTERRLSGNLYYGGLTSAMIDAASTPPSELPADDYSGGL